MTKGHDDSNLRYRNSTWGERGSWFEADQSKPLTGDELEKIKEQTKGRLNQFLSGRMINGHKYPTDDKLIFEIPLESLALTVGMAGVNKKQAETILDELVSGVKGLAKTEKGYKVVDAAELLKVYGTGAAQNRILTLLETSKSPLTAAEINNILTIKNIHYNIEQLVREKKIKIVGKKTLSNKNFAVFYGKA